MDECHQFNLSGEVYTSPLVIRGENHTVNAAAAQKAAESAPPG
jgi:hypothetical protein